MADGLQVTWLTFACACDTVKPVPMIPLPRGKVLARAVCRKCGAECTDMRNGFILKTAALAYPELIDVLERG